MEINYYSRNKHCGFSIKKVFDPIISENSKIQHVSEFEVPSYRADPISIIRNILFVFRHRNKNGINHITGDIHYCVISLIGCKSILTIHDLGFIDNELDKKGKIYTFYRKLLWVNIPVFLATRVTCISEKTAETIKSYIPLKYHYKISVIHNPITLSFKNIVRQSINSKPLILHIGTKSNKNLERVIIALKGINCVLNIIGHLNENQNQLLIDSSIEFVNEVNLSDAEIAFRYQACDIVSFPSLYEGFGMPIIEAQSFGKAVLTSNIEPMNSIAGGGAILVDPTDIESIRNGFVNLLNDNMLMKRLVENGIENLKKFDPHYISQKYFELYTTI